MVEQDDANGLKKALTTLFNDPKLRQKLSEQAKVTAKNYAWPKVMDRVEKFYQAAADQPKKNRIRKLIKE